MSNLYTKILWAIKSFLILSCTIIIIFWLHLVAPFSENLLFDAITQEIYTYFKYEQ